jgi:hypothetical protein
VARKYNKKAAASLMIISVNLTFLERFTIPIASSASGIIKGVINQMNMT